MHSKDIIISDIRNFIFGNDNPDILKDFADELIKYTEVAQEKAKYQVNNENQGRLPYADN